MHKKIDEGVNFSFNYNVLLLVASVLAGLGLVSNSSVTIIASMLVSPIMGPVVGLAYGTTIRDWKLVRRSLRNESISLLACIVMGITIAACTAKTSLSDSWPTNEMASRTTLESKQQDNPYYVSICVTPSRSLLTNVLPYRFICRIACCLL